MGERNTLGKLNKNIPDDCKKQIREAAEGNKHYDCVYRVAKWGKIEERAFLSTFEEIQEGYIEDDEMRYPKKEIGTYSTSVYTQRKNCDKYIRLLKRKLRLREMYPYPVVVQGKTSNGMVQKTVERDEGYLDDTHVDWWIYNDRKSVVLKDFSIV